MKPRKYYWDRIGMMGEKKTQIEQMDRHETILKEMDELFISKKQAKKELKKELRKREKWLNQISSTQTKNDKISELLAIEKIIHEVLK